MLKGLGLPAAQTLEVMKDAPRETLFIFRERSPKRPGEIHLDIIDDSKEDTGTYGSDAAVGEFFFYNLRGEITAIQSHIEYYSRNKDDLELEMIVEELEGRINKINTIIDTYFPNEDVYRVSSSSIYHPEHKGIGLGKVFYLVAMDSIYPGWIIPDIVGGTSLEAQRVWLSIFDDPDVETMRLAESDFFNQDSEGILIGDPLIAARYMFPSQIKSQLSIEIE
jgi:hypothetical protein